MKKSLLFALALCLGASINAADQTDAIATIVTKGNKLAEQSFIPQSAKTTWDTAVTTSNNADKDDQNLETITAAYTALGQSPSNVFVIFKHAGTNENRHIAVNDNGALVRETVATTVNTAATLNYIFYLVPAENGFRIYSPKASKYIKHTEPASLTANASEASIYALDVYDASTGALGVYCAAGRNNNGSNKYFHNNKTETIQTYNAGANSSWTITQSELENVTIANTEITNYADVKAVSQAALEATGLLTSEEAAQLYSSSAINSSNFQLTSVSDYMTDVSEKKKAIDNQLSALMQGIREKLDGKKVYLRAQADGNGSTHGALHLASDGNLKHYTDLAIEGVWEVGFSDNMHISLKNLIGNKYASALTNSQNATYYGFALAHNDSGAFTLANENQSGDNFLNKHNNNAIGYWSAAAGDYGSQWKISLLSEEDENKFIATLNAKYASLAAKEVGTNLGQYTFTPENALATWKNQIDAIPSEGNRIDQICAVALSEPIPTYNWPQPGRFLLFKGAHNTGTLRSYVTLHYTTKTGSNATATHAANKGMTVDNTNDGYEDCHSIMYYDGQHLLSYSHGYHLISNSEHYARFATDPSDNTGAEVGFVQGYNQDGTYQIIHKAQDNSYKNLHINGSGSPKWYLTFSTVNNLNTTVNDVLNNWFVEYVTELPIAIHADGKGTGYIPVAVKIADSDADDFQAYIARTDEDGNLVFSKVETGGEIPANTAFVIKKVSETSKTKCTMAIVENPTETAAAFAMPNERFIASHIATAAPADDDEKVVYVKSATSTDDLNAENGVVFDKATSGQTIPAGTLAFYALKNTTEVPETFTLNLAESNSATTAINEIGVDTPVAQGAVYDLQGRRLSAPARGINIINGRKVLVK